MQDSEFNHNKEIKKHFLVNRPIPKSWKLQDESAELYGYIYCIENKISGRKYIGSTYATYVGVVKPGPLAALSKRANQYIYEYNKALKNTSNSVKQTYRPILQAILEYGIENFVMYPIAETSQETHTKMEQYFIDFFDTMNFGYNIAHPIPTNKNKGRKLTLQDKISRSEPVICINMNLQQIIFSDSMKLFADYLGVTKDLIKNANRKGKPYKGWFIFYIDKSKREYILINNVINDQNVRTQDRHSQKAKDFYTGLYDSINHYLEQSPKENDEYFPNFKRLDDLIYTE